MVHLQGVSTDKEVEEQSIGSIGNVKFPSLEDDDASSGFAASVYGSKWAGQDLPHHEMPDGPMPKEIAYRMIK